SQAATCRPTNDRAAASKSPLSESADATATESSTDQSAKFVCNSNGGKGCRPSPSHSGRTSSPKPRNSTSPKPSHAETQRRPTNASSKRATGTTPRPLITSCLDGDALAEDGAGRHPPVDPPAVVADLEPLPLDRLDQVQVLPAVHLAQHDVADPQRLGVDRD